MNDIIKELRVLRRLDVVALGLEACPRDYFFAIFNSNIRCELKEQFAKIRARRITHVKLPRGRQFVSVSRSHYSPIEALILPLVC